MPRMKKPGWKHCFVVLKSYKLPQGFEDAITFTDSVALFEDFWEEWLNTKLYLLAKGTDRKSVV